MNSNEHPLIAARKRLDEAEKLRVKGNGQDAKRVCESLLTRYPDYYGALHTLGLILADSGDYRNALGALTQAHGYFPENSQTLVALSTVYLQIGSRDLALECIQKAASRNQDDAALQLTLGKILDEERDYDRARDAFLSAMKLDPDWREPQLLLAFCYENLGEFDESRSILLGRIEKGDTSLSVLAGLLQLPPSPSDSMLDEFFSTIPVNESDSRYLFARAHIRHRSGDPQKAWSDLVAANRMKATSLVRERENNRIWQEQSLNYATKFGGENANDNSQYPTSLFILGPSRSGKSTAEAVISQASSVDRGFENSIPVQVARKTFRMAGYPTSFQWPLLPKALEDYVREEFARLLRLRSGSARVFTNTSPARIHDITRIFSTIPNSRALFIKRDVYDLAFRIFGKNYASGNFYAYDLNDIVSHVTWYYKMIDIIVKMYPNRCAVINYEEIVVNPEVVIDAAHRVCGDIGFIDASIRLKSDVGCSKEYRDEIKKAYL